MRLKSPRLKSPKGKVLDNSELMSQLNDMAWRMESNEAIARVVVAQLNKRPKFIDQILEVINEYFSRKIEYAIFFPPKGAESDVSRGDIEDRWNKELIEIYEIVIRILAASNMNAKNKSLKKIQDECDRVRAKVDRAVDR